MNLGGTIRLRVFSMGLICLCACAETALGERGENIAEAVIAEYIGAKNEFFAQEQTADQERQFFLSWRDRLVAAAEQVPWDRFSCKALSKAESISNSLGDYAASVDIIENILNSCPDSDDSWLLELGEVSRLVWRTAGNQAYGRKSLDSFLAVLAGGKADKDLRILVSGWLSGMVENNFSTTEEMRKSLDYVNESIKTLEGSYEPNGRMIGTGFTLPWFVERGVSLAVWGGRYDAALRLLEQYTGFDGRPLTACGVLVSADRSPKCRVVARNELDKYAEFLDSWLESHPQDLAAIEVRMIPARRYFRQGNLEQSKERFEELLNKFQGEIDASPSRNRILTEIWVTLRIIYGRLGDEALEKKAAVEAIAAKKLVGLSAKGEEDILKRMKRKEDYFTDIADADAEKSEPRFWFLVINILVVIVVVGLLVRRRLHQSD